MKLRCVTFIFMDSSNILTIIMHPTISVSIMLVNNLIKPQNLLFRLSNHNDVPSGQKNLRFRGTADEVVRKNLR